MVHRKHSSHCCVFAGSVYTELLPSSGLIRHSINEGRQLIEPIEMASVLPYSNRYFLDFLTKILDDSTPLFLFTA
jgi:hypothetical protein